MKKLLQATIVILILQIPFLLLAQTSEKHTRMLKEGQDSPKASIQEVAWIAGYWTGEGLGGRVEEFWSPPSGRNMSCVFKMVKDDKVSFFEICSISEENGTLMLRLKHFNGDLTGWEEKNQTQNFALVAVEGKTAYFDGLTFVKVSEDQLDVYVVTKKKDGSEGEFKFSYSRTSIE